MLSPLPDIPYRVERSRNRHSRASLQGDMIVIRLARGLSAAQEREHVRNLLRRMTKQVLKDRGRPLIDPFRPLLQGEQELMVAIAEGGTYRFTLSPAARTRPRQTSDGWHVDVGPTLRGKTLHTLLWKLLAQSEEPIMDARIREINNRTLKVPITGTRLRYAATQWGSCSPSDLIMLNTALLFTGEELLNYVVVHELAHCRHKNHGKRFWDLVASIMPEYDEARRILRNYRIVPL